MFSKLTNSNSVCSGLINSKTLLLIALINIAAGIYSLQYYFPQLKETNPLLWLFVIDCPLYAIIFGISLIAFCKKKNMPFLFAISIIGNIKYGLWTIFVLFIGGELQYWIFILSHLLLIIQIILFYKKTIFKLKHFIIVLFWFLFNDVLDYFLGIHPAIGNANFEQVMIFSFVSTIVLSFVILTLFSKK